MPKEWEQFLVTFPTPGPWTVPNSWHIDFDFQSSQAGLSGLLIFSFLADVVHQGGGTAALNGSHRLIQRFVATQPPDTFTTAKRSYKAFFRSNSWLQELSAVEVSPDRTARFVATEHVIEGIPVQVFELSGKAGDIVIGHPLLLHSTAPNCGPRPRFMRVQRISFAGKQA